MIHPAKHRHRLRQVQIVYVVERHDSGLPSFQFLCLLSSFRTSLPTGAGGPGARGTDACQDLVGKDDYNDNDDTTKAVLQRVDFDDFSKVVEAGGRPLGYR